MLSHDEEGSLHYTHRERNRYGRLELERKHRHTKRQHDHAAKHVKGCPPNPPIEVPDILGTSRHFSALRTYRALAQLPGKFEIRNQPLQLRVLRLGLFQDGNVRVGILPERKEVIIFRAGLGGVAL